MIKCIIIMIQFSSWDANYNLELKRGQFTVIDRQGTLAHCRPNIFWPQYRAVDDDKFKPYKYRGKSLHVFSCCCCCRFCLFVFVVVLFFVKVKNCKLRSIFLFSLSSGIDGLQSFCYCYLSWPLTVSELFLRVIN